MKPSKFRIIFISVLILFSCSDNDKKEKLVEAFRSFEARNVPLNIFTIDRLQDFDLLKQKQHTIDTTYNYPSTFVLGLYNNNLKSYTRIHIIHGFSPNDNYDLIKAVSNKYTSDTTYLDNIQLTDTVYLYNKDVKSLNDTLYRISTNNIQSSFKMKDKKYIALVYRKTNSLRDTTAGKWAMWKREIVRLAGDGDGLFGKTIEKMNEHLF